MKQSYGIPRRQCIKQKCSKSEEAVEVLLYEGEDECHKNKSCKDEGQAYPPGQPKDLEKGDIMTLLSPTEDERTWT